VPEPPERITGIIFVILFIAALGPLLQAACMVTLT
jgi:hypothetical protein